MGCSYDAIRPLLLKAGTTVIEKQAERRVLMLVNPSMGKTDSPFLSEVTLIHPLVLAPPNTTDTLYAGLQLVMPGETAPAHRHTAFACRFIIEGEFVLLTLPHRSCLPDPPLIGNGGFTAVHGKRIKMHRGDFILTPTWNFHVCRFPLHSGYTHVYKPGSFVGPWERIGCLSNDMARRSGSTQPPVLPLSLRATPHRASISRCGCTGMLDHIHLERGHSGTSRPRWASSSLSIQVERAWRDECRSFEGDRRPGRTDRSWSYHRCDTRDDECGLPCGGRYRSIVHRRHCD